MSFFGGKPFWKHELARPNYLNFNPHADGWKHDSSGPWIRPIGGDAAVYCLDKANVPGRVGERQATSHLFVSLEGLPLTVFAGMYLTVRRLLDALEGVDTKRVDPTAAYPWNPLGAGEERARRIAMEMAISEQRRKPDYNPRAQPQGVRWLDGVLAAPAPRQPYGPWLQLARFDHSVPGRMGLLVLPSEEWRVGSLPRAEAMVAIERGETDLAEGTPVQFFMLD
jgi:molybdopterin biosynthesis enzyme